MRKTLVMSVLLTCGVFLSCTEREDEGSAGADSRAKEEYRSPGCPEFAEGDYTPWMSKADQQLAYENRKEGFYFAFTEGRCNGGLLEFRHVLKDIPEDQFNDFGIFWSLSADEFYRIDLEMQKKGFVRENLQVFEDGEGKAYHQALWLSPKT